MWILSFAMDSTVWPQSTNPPNDVDAQRRRGLGGSKSGALNRLLWQLGLQPNGVGSGLEVTILYFTGHFRLLLGVRERDSNKWNNGCCGNLPTLEIRVQSCGAKLTVCCREQPIWRSWLGCRNCSNNKLLLYLEIGSISGRYCCAAGPQCD